MQRQIEGLFDMHRPEQQVVLKGWLPTAINPISLIWQESSSSSTSADR